MKPDRIIERLTIIQCFADGAAIAAASDHPSISSAFNEIAVRINQLADDIAALAFGGELK